MNLIYIWHDYKYRSKILFGTILIPAYGLVVTDLEILCKSLLQIFNDLFISKYLHEVILYLT